MVIRPAAVFGALILVAAPSLGAGVIFRLEDPRGDDHGNGLLEYPSRSDFVKGDLDLVELTARRAGDGTWFEATFANDVRIAGREATDELGNQLDRVARLGFYTINIDIYVDTDRKPGSGARAMLPGRYAEVDSDFAWEKAIAVTPRPHEARGELKRLMARELSDARRDAGVVDESAPIRRELQRELGTGLDEQVYFPNQVKVRGRVLRFFVPNDFLGGPASADWAYVVVVTGADLIQSLDLAAAAGLADTKRDSLMVVPVSPGRWKDRFGGGRDDEEIQPPILDAIVPAGSTQEGLLRNFSTADNLPARLPGVVPGAVLP